MRSQWQRSSWLPVVAMLLSVTGAGCSLLYPFELPDAEAGSDVDAEDVVPEADDGAGAGADADDGGSVCGNGVWESGEECDTTEPLGACTTECGSTGIGGCVDCRETCEAPADELCNGDDDDCDGATDEGFLCAAGSEVACTTACDLPGTGTCSATCEPPGRAACVAADEACNGCDDDRDGDTDEGCACASGWATEHPLAPGPETLHSLTAAPDGTPFAVGAAGIALIGDGTEWTRHDAPGGLALRGVSALSHDLAVAVGDYGAVFWWNGAAWRYDDTPGVSETLYVVRMRAENDVWVAGGGGLVLRWNGANWTTVPTGTTRHLFDLLVRDDDDIWACGTVSTVVHYDGASWTTIAVPGWMTEALETLLSFDSSTIWAAGRSAIIGRYHIDTGTWEQMVPDVIETFWSMWGAGPEDVWLVGGYGAGDVILHYDGTAWRRSNDVPSIEPRGLTSVFGRTADDVFAVGRGGALLHWDGRAWRPMEGGVTASLRAVAGRSGQEVFAVGTAVDGRGIVSTGLLRSDAGRWRLADWREGFGACDLWAAAPDRVLAVAGDGSVRVFDGAYWAVSPVGLPGVALWGIWEAGPDDVFAVGGFSTVGGPIALVGDAGGSWRPLSIVPNPGELDLLAVHGASADAVFAVGTNGLAVRRTGELAMEVLPTGTTATLRDVWVAAADEAFAVGEDGTILHWDGAAWTTMSDASGPWAGLRLAAVWGSSADNVFVAGDAGLLLRYDGTAWTELPMDALGNLTGVWGSVPNNVYVTMNDRSGRILHRCGPAW